MHKLFISYKRYHFKSVRAELRTCARDHISFYSLKTKSSYCHYDVMTSGVQLNFRTVEWPLQGSFGEN